MGRGSGNLFLSCSNTEAEGSNQEIKVLPINQFLKKKFKKKIRSLFFFGVS